MVACTRKACVEGRLFLQCGVLWGRVSLPLWPPVGERSKVTCWAVWSWADDAAMILREGLGKFEGMQEKNTNNLGAWGEKC